MIKKTKIFVISFLLILSAATPIINVKANESDNRYNMEVEAKDAGTQKEEKPQGGNPQGGNNNLVDIKPNGTTVPNNPIIDISGDCYRSSCSIARTFSAWSRINVDMYDMYGNKTYNATFLAGTYVGLNIIEEKGYSSSATYTYKAEKKVFSCTKRVWSNCAYEVTVNGIRVCTGGYVDGSKYTQECACDPNDKYNGQGTWQEYAGDPSSCAAQAQPYSIDMSAEPSYNITYRDSNDIETDKPSSYRYNTMDSVILGNCNTNTNVQKRTNTMECSFQYNRDEACINVKNGKISYDLPCEEGEYEIKKGISKDGKTYWKYFIPLNANSSGKFNLLLTAKGTQIGLLCKQIIDKYSNYTERIVDINGNLLSTKPERAKREVEDGCRYQMNITIPIVQKFYNEQENGINFKGFNFYYKPIDINNPFPNGITDTSLWYEWSEDKTILDLSKSYDEITYVANITNPSIIRKYNDTKQDNKENPYTNWYTMYLDGKSSFISEMINEGLIATNNITRERIYPLGCGPWNENQYNEDGSKNYFYQPECGNK